MSGTFCPRCGKGRYLGFEDKTVVAGWDTGDDYFFVNHCLRCSYTMCVWSSNLTPGKSPGKREFDDVGLFFLYLVFEEKEVPTSNIVNQLGYKD